MRIALGAIISPLEKPYLKEWLTYHINLGIKTAYLGLNNWSDKDLAYVKSLHIPDMYYKCFIVNGPRQQLNCYNQITIQSMMDRQDFVAYIDCDEFLKVRSDRKLEEILNDYSDYPAIGINWRLYGSNGLEKYEDKPVVERFKRCDNLLNQHVKMIINTKWWNKQNWNMLYRMRPVFQTPHNIESPWVNLEKQITSGPFNKTNLDLTHELELAHYFCKSKEEYEIRRNYPRADCGEIRTNIWETFEEHDKNEIDESELK